jgi:hypothetical protein
LLVRLLVRLMNLEEPQQLLGLSPDSPTTEGQRMQQARQMELVMVLGAGHLFLPLLLPLPFLLLLLLLLGWALLLLWATRRRLLAAAVVAVLVGRAPLRHGAQGKKRKRRRPTALLTGCCP